MSQGVVSPLSFFLARQTALICRAKVITIVPSFQITVNSGEPITLYVAGVSVMFWSRTGPVVGVKYAVQ